VSTNSGQAHTVASVLWRAGRIRRRRPRVRLWTVEGRPYVKVNAPNDLWTVDTKGWWRARNGDKCEPLTVRDACSRKVLAVTLLACPKTENVRRVLQDLFLRHGLPATIQCDNGTPKCARSQSPGRPICVTGYELVIGSRHNGSSTGGVHCEHVLGDQPLGGVPRTWPGNNGHTGRAKEKPRRVV